MDPIRRTGPPTPTDVRGDVYDVSVPLSAIPSYAWRRTFEAPAEWQDPWHPSRIRVKGHTLHFTSDEMRLGQWIEWIDRWIDAANKQLGDAPNHSGGRESVQDDQAQERLRRLQEATERFKMRGPVSAGPPRAHRGVSSRQTYRWGCA